MNLPSHIGMHRLHYPVPGWHVEWKLWMKPKVTLVRDGPSGIWWELRMREGIRRSGKAQKGKWW